MQDKLKIIKEIDVAIDAMDTNKVDAGLQALSELEPRPIPVEDVKLFASRIQKLNKENVHMKKPFRSIPVAIAAALILLMGLTVYAATALNLFSFQLGDRFVTFRTTENMTEQEAKDFISKGAEEPATPGAALQADTQDFTFDSAEQAMEALDMEIPIPSSMPDMSLESANGSVMTFSENVQRHTVWLNYSDANGRMFGITVSREIVKPGSDVTGYSTNDIDDGSLGKYTSKSGIEFTTLTESDDTGTKTAHIATAMIGEYEYALVFFGFNEDERSAVIDSLDLSVYSE